MTMAPESPVSPMDPIIPQLTQSSPGLPGDLWVSTPTIHEDPDHHSPASAATSPSSIRMQPVHNNSFRTDQRLDNPRTTIELDQTEQTTEKPLDATSPPSSNGKTIGDEKAAPIFSLFAKLGILTTSILIAGSTCILGAVGFLWFLWLADYLNSTWHRIVYNNWFTRCVSLSALVIRTAISLQSSAATSMVASLALEQTGVLLLHLASVSLTRNANGGPYMLAWWLLKTFIRSPERWRNTILPTLIILLAIVTFSIQFTTTALLSDVNSVIIPGPSENTTLATNFAYGVDGSIPVVTRGTTWTMKPPFYPAFAEYHEDAPNTADGLIDTGLTLRAFAPLQDQQSRAQLKDYQGRAMVLDSRVVCMRPNLTSERVHIADSLLAFEGLFNAPFNASRLEYFTQEVNGSTQPLTDWNARPNTNFTCLAPLAVVDAAMGYNSTLTQMETAETPLWRISFCQPYGLQSPGVLLSEFKRLENAARSEVSGDWNYANGVVYLAINVSSGNQKEWLGGLGEEDSRFGDVTGPGYAPLAYSNHGEWLDLLFGSNATLRLSVSMCYTAFDTADLDIIMSGSTNRTEPVPTYDIEKGSYTYGAVRRQFGQLPNGQVSYDNDGANARGILNLQKRPSWLLGADDYKFNGSTLTGGTSWITDFGNMGGPTVYGAVNERVGYDTSAFLYNGNREPGSWTNIDSINPDPSMISLVQEIVQSGGSVAFALQSIITSLAGVAYYDQLQQFNDATSITHTEFIVATARTEFRGLIGVSSVVAAHLVLMGVVIGFFLVKAHLSTMGNPWQAVAQVNGELTKPLLETAPLATDSMVEDVLKTKGWKRKIVGIAVSEDGKRIEIVGMMDKYARVSQVEEPRVAE